MVYTYCVAAVLFTIFVVCPFMTLYIRKSTQADYDLGMRYMCDD